MYGTAFLLQEEFLRVSIRLILGDGILVGLPSIVILQLEGSKRKTIDKDDEVYLIGILLGIHHLADNTKDVLLVRFLSTRIEFRWQRIVEVECSAIELISLSKHIHHSSLGDF